MIAEGTSPEEAKNKIWMYDVHGLIVQVSFIQWKKNRIKLILTLWNSYKVSYRHTYFASYCSC